MQAQSTDKSFNSQNSQLKLMNTQSSKNFLQPLNTSQDSSDDVEENDNENSSMGDMTVTRKKTVKPKKQLLLATKVKKEELQNQLINKLNKSNVNYKINEDEKEHEQDEDLQRKKSKTQTGFYNPMAKRYQDCLTPGKRTTNSSQGNYIPQSYTTANTQASSNKFTNSLTQLQKTSQTLNEHLLSTANDSYYNLDMTGSGEDNLNIQVQYFEPFQQENIFQKEKDLKGYKDILESHHLDDKGEIITRSIVGPPEWYQDVYKKVNGREVGLGSRNKVLQQRKKNHVGSSSIMSLNKRTESNDMKPSKYRNGIKSKNDLKYELIGIKARLDKVKQDEEQSLKQLKPLTQEHMTKQDRQLSNYQQALQHWDDTTIKMSKQIQRPNWQQSLLENEGFRCKNELRSLGQMRSEQDLYFEQVRNWRLNLRKNNSQSQANLKTSNSFSKLQDIPKQVVTPQKKHPRTYGTMSDFPHGFHDLVAIDKQTTQDFIRNPFHLTGYKRYDNINNPKNKDLFMSTTDYYGNVPEISDLQLKGESQYQRELKMVSQSKFNYFSYKNPKIIQKENSEQLIMMCNDDLAEKTYDKKAQGFESQYIKTKKKKAGKTISKNLEKVRIFTRVFAGLRHGKEEDYNPNLNQKATESQKQAVLKEFQSQ